MITFFLILAGLVSFNFILLKFSMQSVDTNKKKTKAKVQINHISNQEAEKAKNAEIPTAA
ncbi:hypothetical protein D1816_06195 [Aquimarina sp. AD10]|uniref:Uncharacterized protein n=1 Tax=Aquimarina aggregata TaxID=1642818 RepID=A0A163C4L4_9FLAO|nr:MULTISPECIES: hypothetical protein [Aquimarina]AXT59959.1 hypothetical protein D1816_06195 [Aquimarina sp. AD10]KZS42052.1 hypothetical protein AWE51_01010 [Aquimarina aggregata]RKM95678.1 hypothetical protein D7033_16705 [Aquimarina sp. AD10]